MSRIESIGTADMLFPTASQRIDIFDHTRPVDLEPAWRTIRQYGRTGAHSLIKVGEYWYCCFAAKSDHVWDITVVLRSRNGEEWEDTDFPFKNADCQTEPTMCADAAGRIHLTFEDHWQRTGYCVYADGAWGRIKPFPRFPERVLIDSKDQLLIDSRGDLILMATRHNECQLYSRRKSGDHWGEAEALRLPEEIDLAGAVTDATDTIHLLLHSETQSTFFYLRRNADLSWSSADEIPVEKALGMTLAINPQGILYFAAITESEVLLLTKYEIWHRRRVCAASLSAIDLPRPTLQWLSEAQALIFWTQSTSPLFGGLQILCVDAFSSADPDVAIPVNVTQDDSANDCWSIAASCYDGSRLGLLVANTGTHRPYWFSIDAVEIAYLAQWRQIVAASNPREALQAYFETIVHDANVRAQLMKCLAKLKHVSIESGGLSLSFDGDFRLYCAPPACMEAEKAVPASYVAMAALCNQLVLRCPGRRHIVFPGLNSQGELKTAVDAMYRAVDIAAFKKFRRLANSNGQSKPEHIKLAFEFDHRWLIFNPQMPNSRGEPAICLLDYDAPEVARPLALDLGVGDVFMGVVADEILGERVFLDIGASTERLERQLPFDEEEDDDQESDLAGDAPDSEPDRGEEIIIGGKTFCRDETQMDLSELGLKTLSPEIGLFKTLETLDLSGNVLMTLPEEIGELTALVKLNVGNNPLIVLPDTLSNLRNLEALYLYGTWISILPQGLEKLINLREIMADAVPQGVGQFRNLEKISTERISEDVGTLEALTELRIRGNHPQPFPGRMPDLPGLTTLYLREMDFDALPEVVFGLSSLQSLHIVHCKNLISLPPDISRLKNLDHIFLYGCSQLAHIPEEIRQLKKLRYLSVTDTPLTSSSLSIVCSLTGLKDLSLLRVKLTDISEALPAVKKSIRCALPDCRVSF